MASVRHLQFVMTSSYSMQHEIAFYVPNFVLNFHDVRLRIFLNLVFHVSAFWLEIAYFGLNFDEEVVNGEWRLLSGYQLSPDLSRILLFNRHTDTSHTETMKSHKDLRFYLSKWMNLSL